MFRNQNGANNNNDLLNTNLLFEIIYLKLFILDAQNNSNKEYSIGEIFKKYILTYLYCTKYNKINTFHLNVQNIFIIKKWY